MAELSGEIQQALAAAELRLPELDSPEEVLLDAMASGVHPDLIHPLSGYMVSFDDAAKNAGRDNDNAELARHFGNVDLRNCDAKTFIATLRGANRQLDNCTGLLRRDEVGLAANATQLKVLFPDAKGIQVQLAEIRALLQESPLSLFSAIVALGMLLNCHPFADGNGRVARALYAHLLQHLGAAPGFNLHRYFAPTNRSFDLCLREAEVRGDWGPFILHNCLIITRTAGSGAADMPSTRPVAAISGAS